ncbi:hypothetical protein ES705_34804 [subsurface metagenome]
MVQNQVTTRISQGDYSKMLKCCADLGCTPYEYLQKLIIDDLNSYSEHLKNPDNLDPVEVSDRIINILKGQE